MKKNESTLSGLLASDFNKTVDGKEVTLCVLKNNNGCELAVTNYGATIVSLMVPDKNGAMTDVVTGYRTLEDYFTSERSYLGAVCGRYGNRIAKGRFELDGVVFDKLVINNGPNHLHGGAKGFDSVVWNIKQEDDQTVILSYISTDGDEGYPGTLHVALSYHLSNNNTLRINYIAETDKPTVLNLTNHSYFNLSGVGDPSIDDHIVTINADHYLPTDAVTIPFGPSAEVENTPMDFRTPHAIGERINDSFEQLIFGGGYDHTFIIINNKPNELGFAGRCESPKTGIVMDIFTTEPGLQLYTGNWLTGDYPGKLGHRYPRRSALCFETQHFPDSPNKPEYPTTVLRPGEQFISTTEYKFSTK
ncbi:MAG: galactose mutarotase [Tannerella sp.]|jgi:aldose 1-epimerase|nr:galactose mutarotase [Tannerella sp.]